MKAKTIRIPKMFVSAVGVSVAAVMAMTGVSAAGAKTNRAGLAAAATGNKVDVREVGTLPAALPAGYVIATSAEITAINGLSAFAEVTCPGATKPVGGGAYVASTSVLVNLQGSYPRGTRDWAVDVNNRSGADTTIQAYAVCANRGSAMFTVVSKSFVETANAQKSGQVHCPTGVIVGGGVYIQSDDEALSINSMYPYGKSAWRVDVNDNGPLFLGSFVVYGICRNVKPAGYSVQIGTAVSNPAGAQTPVTATCPGASVPLSGGVFSNSGAVTVSINESAPQGQSWVSYENNSSANDALATPYAICAGK